MKTVSEFKNILLPKLHVNAICGLIKCLVPNIQGCYRYLFNNNITHLRIIVGKKSNQNTSPMQTDSDKK